MTEKPRFKLVEGNLTPLDMPTTPSKVDLARKKFGKPFAHEEGSPWVPRTTRLLTDWLSKRTREKA